MAANYPIEVVEADRWLSDPGNAALRDADLAGVVGQQPWDPSVKSLTAFPDVLRMLDGHIDWTESLGEAFAANPRAVMDTVQDLRRRAIAAGALRSTPYITVSDAGGIVTIRPAAAQEIYYPAYDPTTAYGPWPYPEAPPYAFDDIYDGGCSVGAFGYCWYGLAVIAPLWGWSQWDWRGHHILIDPRRYATLNNARPSAGGRMWVQDEGHRHGVGYATPDTLHYPAAGHGAPWWTSSQHSQGPFALPTAAARSSAAPAGWPVGASSRIGTPAPLAWRGPPPATVGPRPQGSVAAPASIRPAPAAEHARGAKSSGQQHSQP